MFVYATANDGFGLGIGQLDAIIVSYGDDALVVSFTFWDTFLDVGDVVFFGDDHVD